MYLLVSLVAVAALVLHPVGAAHTFPITVLQGDVGDTCPSVQESEVARQNITSTVRNILSRGIVPSCGDGVWRNVVSLNMSDSSQQCPSPWREYTSIQSCGRPVVSRGCESVTFSTSDVQYNKVCGRAIGYQYHSTDCFVRFISQPTGTADDNYVDGLSVTYGSNPRNHVWTFATGLSEPNEETIPGHRKYACPCAAPSDPRFGTPPPSYVGNNYFCESGHVEPNYIAGHHSEPLWDGDGCVNSQCCTFNTPPWFSVQLPEATADDIEVRICGDQGTNDEDTTIGLLELYVQ